MLAISTPARRPASFDFSGLRECVQTLLLDPITVADKACAAILNRKCLGGISMKSRLLAFVLTASGLLASTLSAHAIQITIGLSETGFADATFGPSPDSNPVG